MVYDSVARLSVAELGAESDLEFIDDECPGGGPLQGISAQQTAELLGLSEPQHSQSVCFLWQNKCICLMLPNSKFIPCMHT